MTAFPGLTAVDLNRAGVPLAEIVSEPDLRSPGEARAYLTALKQVLVYAGVSDCSHGEGPPPGGRQHLRAAARRDPARHQDRGEERQQLRERRAGAGRRTRPADRAARGRRHRSRRSRCSSMPPPARSARCASKEESHDYRYFPDPDLPPLVLRAGLGRGGAARAAGAARCQDRARLVAQYGLPAYDAGVLAGDVALADYFEAVVAAGTDPKAAANWVMSEVISAWNDTGTPGRVRRRDAGGPVGAREGRDRQPPGGEEGLRRAGGRRGRAARRGGAAGADPGPGRVRAGGVGGRGPRRAPGRGRAVPRRRNQADGVPGRVRS